MAEAPEEPREGPDSESAAAASGGTGLVVGVWIGAGVFILALAGLAAWGVNTVVGTASKMEAPGLSAVPAEVPVPVEGPFVAREVESVAPPPGSVATSQDQAPDLEGTSHAARDEAPSQPPVVAAVEPVTKHDLTRLRRAH